MGDGEAFVLRVLGVVAKYEQHDDLWWRADGEYAPVTFFINCNDLFWWGTGDCERVTPENVGALEQAYADAAAAHRYGRSYGGNLFCCRVRGMRPQGCCYPEDRELWPLFDACGPEREIEIGNPYPPGGKVR
jgi:hypothetical protein